MLGTGAPRALVYVRSLDADGGLMSDPFTEWRGKTAPYWLSDASPGSEETHRRLLATAEALHRELPPQHWPNPLARTWHDP